MKYGLIGEHLPHSFSQTVHEKFNLYEYVLKELTLDEFKSFMKKKEFIGVNITIPYKEIVFPFVDVIDKNAQEIGAINTVSNKNGKLYGYNTDFYGLKSLILKEKIQIANKKVAVLGGGGTSKTAISVAKSLNAREIVVVSREKKKGFCNYKELKMFHKDVDIIINTTPVGMYPKNDETPVNLDDFTNLSGVVDVIYNPLKSRLVLGAEQLGIKACSGLYMLVAQASQSADIFLESAQTKSKLEGIYNELLSEKTNIVLIGMPASGKSTIAKELSRKTNRPLFDTDEIIVKKHGHISEIFERFGEKYFRDIETEIIKRVSEINGAIIATGGGAVLRKENTDALKQNGKLYFLDKPLESLLPTKDRPLANSAEKIKQLYNERINIYRALSQDIVKVTDIPEDSVAQILQKHD